MKEQLITDPQANILVACSGGLDSNVLLHILSTLGYKCHPSHVNYRLRGTDSDADLQSVIEMATKMGLPIHTYTISDDELVKLKHSSLQERAREIRYNFFNQVMLAQDISICATAHHINDSIETFFINALRGSGSKGLMGISPRNSSFIRPLSCLKKEELEKYASENHINWREDSSNASSVYDRNYIRNEVWPHILSRWPNAHERFQRTINILRDESELLQQHIESIASKIVKTNDRIITIDKDQLMSYKNHQTILFHLLSPYGFNAAQASKIVSTTTSNGSLFHTHSHELLIARSTLIIAPINTYQNETKIIEQYESEVLCRKGILKLSLIDAMKLDPHHHIEVIDAESVHWPLILRSIKEGDRMSPLGMAGKSKKISDILTDAKVNLFEKRNQLVLSDKQGIIWLIGHRIDHRVRIKKSSSKLLKLAWQPDLII